VSSFVHLEVAKRHLRLDSDDEDELIQAYLQAATAYTEAVLGCSLDKDWPAGAKAAIHTAILLMLASLYENREAYAAQPDFAQRAYMALLMPYRKNLGI
jgi:uncharacterized phage protein (predicted DNA packaging)